MKPAWDKLTDDFKDSPTSGVFDADCTAGGKELCEKLEIKGYPTIKYGDPDALKDYSGGRSYEELKEFADENLGPQCGVKSLDICDDETRKLIEGFTAHSAADLKQVIKATEKAISSKEKAYSKKRRKFDEKYEEFQSESSEEDQQLRLQKEEQAKFEKTKDKLSKAEIAKREKKEAKAKERTAKFEKKKAKIEAEKDKFDDERKALDKEIKSLGLKHMKAVLKEKLKEEL
mmetsp:Transcript_41271/g.106799  ORF Transcript_41271/g.106799 Transcript_41271/m.106799 type:complete len:231 (-) Transcript_41271:180-872(-)